MKIAGTEDWIDLSIEEKDSTHIYKCSETALNRRWSGSNPAIARALYKNVPIVVLWMNLSARLLIPFPLNMKYEP